MPSELKGEFPMLTTDDLKLEFVAFTRRPDGYTYDDYVTDYLGSTMPDVYEEFRYLFRNDE